MTEDDAPAGRKGPTFNQPGLPRDFGKWTGPWYITTLSWLEGDSTVTPYEELERWEADVWARPYREKSHCDTPGCCELNNIWIGPELATRKGWSDE